MGKHACIRVAAAVAAVVSAFLAGFWLQGLPAAAGNRGGGGQAFENGDTNGDGRRDLSDAVYLLSWLFTGGPEPVPAGRTECDDRIAELEAKLDACLTGPKGAVAFSWTVSGQAPASACPAAAAVRVRASASPSSDFLIGVFACEDGAGQVDELPADVYLFTFTLDDPTGTRPPVVVSGVPVIVKPDSLTSLPPVDFDLEGGTGLGDATVAWTVNGAQRCPPGGVIRVSFAGDDGRDPIEAASACDAFAVRVSGLRAGVHAVELTLTDPAQPGQAATVRVENVSILAGITSAVGPIDIPCPFCPGG